MIRKEAGNRVPAAIPVGMWLDDPSAVIVLSVVIGRPSCKAIVFAGSLQLTSGGTFLRHWRGPSFLKGWLVGSNMPAQPP